MQETKVADNIINMINDFSVSEKPFMLTASFHGPHFPIAVPPPYDTMYDPEQIEKWGNFDESFINKPTVQQKEMLRWNASHLTWPDWQKVIAHYWGYCSYIDNEIGRILQSIKNSGIEKDTIIIYTCDHGDMLGSHRIFNKGMNMYEETHHIPFIVKMPESYKDNAQCDEFVSLIDFMPTLLDITEVPIPNDIDGKSIVPLLTGEKIDDFRKSIMCEFHGYESALCTIRMVRTDRWKYIYNPCSEDELYDMQSDPHELINLANKLGFKHVLRR